MPRYNFSLVDSQTVSDQGGQVLQDDSQAVVVAEQLAQQLSDLRPELLGQQFAILVRDEHGEEVHRAPLDRQSRRAH
jgi:hypothetical protein